MPALKQVMSAEVFAPEDHLEHLPLYATPKIDGIRFYVQNGIVWSKSNKPIRNDFIQAYVPLLIPSGCDGEFLVGDSHAEDHFQRTSSAVMSDRGLIYDLNIFIFDRVDPNPISIDPYWKRIQECQRWFLDNKQIFLGNDFICHTLANDCPPCPAFDLLRNGQTSFNSTAGGYLRLLQQQTYVLKPTVLRKPEHIDVYLKQCLSKGYEGIMLRRPDGGYKFGRSTSTEALLLKHKPLADSEAVIVGFEELCRNENEATTNEIGRTKRSTSSAGKVPANTLGSFKVRLLSDQSVAFSIGTGIGLTSDLRQQIWNRRSDYLGKIIKFSYLQCGTKDLPRQPKFLGFRDPSDMETT